MDDAEGAAGSPLCSQRGEASARGRRNRCRLHEGSSVLFGPFNVPLLSGRFGLLVPLRAGSSPLPEGTENPGILSLWEGRVQTPTASLNCYTTQQRNGHTTLITESFTGPFPPLTCRIVGGGSCCWPVLRGLSLKPEDCRGRPRALVC